MLLTNETRDKVIKVLSAKKRANPVSGKVVGIGVGLYTDIDSTDVYCNSYHLCSLDELSRMIEEMVMLKESVEEVTGVVL